MIIMGILSWVVMRLTLANMCNSVGQRLAHGKHCVVQVTIDVVFVVVFSL